MHHSRNDPTDPFGRSKTPSDGKVFPQRIPPNFATKIDRNDAKDPLGLQVLVDPREARREKGFVNDPTGDLHAGLGHGVLQKYAGRALWVLDAPCPGNCRFCFRRHYPYGKSKLTRRHVDETLALLAAPPKDHCGVGRGIGRSRPSGPLEEIILSGGEPLSLPDGILSHILRGIEAIPSVVTLRIHTRMPVFTPSRITPAFARLLGRFTRRKVLVAHVNHARELDEKTGHAFAHLAAAGFTLLSQSVLLAGVNDSAPALEALMKALWLQGVTPYYLHQLDPVQGAAHFRVPVAHGKALLAELRRRLPGYLVPRYVLEVPGEASKRPL